MKEGQASQTAGLVCVARAIAHEGKFVPTFSDPTAFELLSPEGKASVREFAKGPPKNAAGRTRYEFLKARAAMMTLRTMSIDESVREKSATQVVILGAGFDGRAFRMTELRDAAVFEVDHPDTQREKRARLGNLAQVAREITFVSVDFTRDDLAECLAKAGHDATQPTVWIWEGVIMYLTKEQVEATLTIIAQRSSPGSRLIGVYLTPGSLMMKFVALLVRRLGEPFRSYFREEEMRSLLAKYGYRIARDENLTMVATRLSPHLAKTARRMAYQRIATADKDA